MNYPPIVAARSIGGRHRRVGVGCHNIIISHSAAKGRGVHGLRVCVMSIDGGPELAWLLHNSWAFFRQIRA
jgi:hypothetical protein